MYRTGGRIDYQAGREYFYKAVQKGSVEAMVYLGFLYLQGKGVEQSTWEAAKYFTQAAEQGHPIAQVHVGLMHRDGVGMRKSPTDAKTWFERASKQGNALGKYSLGEMMLHYENTDWLDIVDLFIAAADKGNSRGLITEDIYIDTLSRVFDGYLKD